MLVRRLAHDDLASLLALYVYLHSEVQAASEILDETWRNICADPRLHYFAAQFEGELVATCALTLVPNLTRGARPYGLIENVVTAPAFRCQGIGTAVLQYALNVAWAAGCYKVMLLTGSKRETTLHFYEQAGFERGSKTGFVAYPA